MSDLLSTLPPLHILITYAFPAILIAIGITGTTNPAAIAEGMGFSKHDKHPHCIWSHGFAVREAALGVCLYALIAANEWKALTIVMAVNGMNGIGDCLVDALKGNGWWHAMKNHGLPTMAGYWVVWRLYQDW